MGLLWVVSVSHSASKVDQLAWVDLSSQPQGSPCRPQVGTAPLLLPSCTEAAPYLVRGLQNVDVFAGEVATFSCEVSRAGGPEAHWWLDGTLLQDGPESAISVHDGIFHSLTLSGLGVADSGTITYRAGPLVSTAKLLVKGIGQWDPAPSWCFCPCLPHMLAVGSQGGGSRAGSRIRAGHPSMYAMGRHGRQSAVPICGT